jgi:hypothetical protein
VYSSNSGSSNLCLDSPRDGKYEQFRVSQEVPRSDAFIPVAVCQVNKTDQGTCVNSRREKRQHRLHILNQEKIQGDHIGGFQNEKPNDYNRYCIHLNTNL